MAKNQDTGKDRQERFRRLMNDPAVKPEIAKVLIQYLRMPPVPISRRSGSSLK